jgi:crotonobetainyl-CoA:carnitine CoA-transferase CaiB-like acyl-CoA transferase
VALNLKTAAGAEALRRIVATADVLVENFRPGTLDRMGFGYEELSAANPRLVYASISGYGRTGPRRHLAGYDPVLQAEAGLMAITGTADGPPVRVGIALTDYLAGLFTLSGILLALRSRDQTGRGQLVDLALFDALMATMTLPAGIYFATGEKPARMGNQHPSIAPYETFNARDGAVMVCAGNPRLWQQFCEAIGRVELTRDPRFQSNEGRLRERAALVAAIEDTLRTLTVDQVIARLESHGVPCGRVRSIDQALTDPQLQARGMVIAMPHPALEMISVIANPLMLSGTPPSYRLPPPALGQHTADVLDSLGYTPDEIARAAPTVSDRRDRSDADDLVFRRS